MISANAIEAVEEIDAFKEKYPFAFQQAVTEQEQQPVEYAAPEAESVQGEEQVLTPEWPLGSAIASRRRSTAPCGCSTRRTAPSRPVVPRITAADIPDLPDDGDIPAEILEFFVPEAEEHLAVVTECLLSLESQPRAGADPSLVPRHTHGKRVGGARLDCSASRASLTVRKIWWVACATAPASERADHRYLPRVSRHAQETPVSPVAR